MFDADTRFTLHPHAAHRTVGGEVFIVTDDRAFHRLESPTAIDLFQALARAVSAGDGKPGASRAELVHLLVGRYDVTPEQAAADVDEFLYTLLERMVAVQVTG